jgi:hypothetical protein
MSLVYHALNYAADGRPLAVTMASAEPLIELKILLHPTLVDNALGYRIIELDRFVDEYTSKDKVLGAARQQMTEHVYAQVGLYKLAWASRLLGLLSLQADTDQTSEISRALRTITDDEKLRREATEALARPEELENPALSPLPVKTEFFDEALVRLMLNAAKARRSLAQFDEEVQADARAQARQAEASGDSSALEALAKRWLNFPPEFEVWSGVRERDYAPTPETLLMPDSQPVPMPFDFMLQVAFTSEPAFLKDEEAKTYADTQPWEFPSLKQTIQERVEQGVAGERSERARTILADVSEFALLQRLFRLAFNGQLGAGFPVERLVELSDAVAPGAPKRLTRTLRWNANPIFDRLAQSGMRADEQDELQSILRIRAALGVAFDAKQSVREYKGDTPLPPLE